MNAQTIHSPGRDTTSLPEVSPVLETGQPHTIEYPLDTLCTN